MFDARFHGSGPRRSPDGLGGWCFSTPASQLVDTFSIPQLMRLIASGRLDPSLFATHRFQLGDTMAAYDTFVTPGGHPKR